jgi:hypothetical protein
MELGCLERLLGNTAWKYCLEMLLGNVLLRNELLKNLLLCKLLLKTIRADVVQQIWF